MKNKNVFYLVIISLLISQLACSIERIESTNVPVINTIQPTISPTNTQIVQIVPTITPEFRIAKTNVEIGLNLREFPNENSKIVFTIPANSKLKVENVENENGWYLVIYDKYVGWVNGNYIIFED